MAEPRWDVYRDENGEPVTVTPQQLRAIWHAIRVWREVVTAEGKAIPFDDASLSKSRLLGRLLLDGRPPLETPPPTWLGAPGYHLAESDLPHYYFTYGPQIANSDTADLMLMAPEDFDDPS